MIILLLVLTGLHAVDATVTSTVNKSYSNSFQLAVISLLKRGLYKVYFSNGHNFTRLS